MVSKVARFVSPMYILMKCAHAHSITHACMQGVHAHSVTHARPAHLLNTHVYMQSVHAPIHTCMHERPAHTLNTHAKCARTLNDTYIHTCKACTAFWPRG